MTHPAGPTELAAPLLTSLRMLARAADLEPRPHTAAWRYRTFAALVLDQGRLFLPDGPVDGDDRRESGRCWANATTWSTEAGLIYVEGWATIEALPFGTEHAWCARPGQPYAFDPTWPPGAATCYLGLPVDPAWRARIDAPQLLSIVHDTGKTLLRDGLPQAARAEAGLPIPTAATV